MEWNGNHCAVCFFPQWKLTPTFEQWIRVFFFCHRKNLRSHLTQMSARCETHRCSLDCNETNCCTAVHGDGAAELRQAHKYIIQRMPCTLPGNLLLLNIIRLSRFGAAPMFLVPTLQVVVPQPTHTLHRYALPQTEVPQLLVVVSRLTHAIHCCNT